MDPNLQEWDYEEYEGRATSEIQSECPGWFPWDDGVIGGQSIGQVAARAQVVVGRALHSSGDALLFALGL